MSRHNLVNFTMSENTIDNPLSEGLTPKQKKFCENYVSKEFYGNGTWSYVNAYQMDMTEKGAYAVAASGAKENLRKPQIYNYINSLLEQDGLNDAFVDKQLLFLINQHDDLSAKTNAIKEYNKLKQRITDKIQHKVDGEWKITREIIDHGKPTT